MTNPARLWLFNSWTQPWCQRRLLIILNSNQQTLWLSTSFPVLSFGYFGRVFTDVSYFSGFNRPATTHKKWTSQHHVFAASWSSSMLSPFVYYWLVNTGDVANNNTALQCYYLLFSLLDKCGTVIEICHYWFILKLPALCHYNFLHPISGEQPLCAFKKNHMDN